MNKNIFLLVLISYFFYSSLLFASCWSDCDDKFDGWQQGFDRTRCKGECEVEQIQETSGYQTNKFDLKGKVEEGGWTVAWSDDITETDAAQGLVAAGVSIYSSNPSLFMEWVNNLVNRTIDSLYADMQEEYRAKAVELATTVIMSAIKGESAGEIAKSMDTIDFKAGAIKYSGTNYVANQALPLKTWGLKPYVAFRIRSSSAETSGNENLRTNFHSDEQGGYQQGQITSGIEEKRIDLEAQRDKMRNDIDREKNEYNHTEKMEEMSSNERIEQNKSVTKKKADKLNYQRDVRRINSNETVKKHESNTIREGNKLNYKRDVKRIDSNESIKKYESNTVRKRDKNKHNETMESISSTERIEQHKLNNEGVRDTYQHREVIESISSDERVELYKTQEDYLKATNKNVSDYLILERKIQSEELGDTRYKMKRRNSDRQKALRDNISNQMAY